MGKLHELVSVANDHRGLREKILAEAKRTFSNRQDHFTGFTRSYESVVDDDYIRDAETKALVTTVRDKMLYIEEQMIKVIDSAFQKESTNCTAKADIIVTEDDGSAETLAKDVPVTTLVQLESEFQSLRSQTYDLIPTLDPTKDWNWDIQNGYYKNEEPRKRVTRKVQTPLVKYEATEKHPAQTEIISTDETTGYYNQVNVSGMTTPSKKRQLLERVDKVIHAIKTARSRANDIEAHKDKIARSLFNYIRTGDILTDN